MAIKRDLSEVRVVATDLDGTFLDSQAQVVPRNRQAVRDAQYRGAVVIPATARSPHSVLGIAQRGLLGPIAVCANGAIGFDLQIRRVLWMRELQAVVIKEIIANLHSSDSGFRFAVETLEEFRAEPGFFPSQPRSFGRVVVTRSLVSSRPIVKLICRHANLGIVGLSDALSGLVDGLEVIPGSIDWVEVVPRGVSKGFGVGLASEILGVDLEDFAAVGDHLNDLSMFAVVGHSFAVSNGHEKARANADEVVGSNEEGGVADVVESAFAY
ncbi:MAG: HAD family hydrolase [Ferrimicrobium sp.]